MKMKRTFAYLGTHEIGKTTVAVKAIKRGLSSVVKSLPNDDEVKAHIDTLPYYGSCTTEYNEGFEDGVKWLKEQIVQYFIMTTDSYINENKTAAFKKGDTVVMHSCGEANFPKYKGKIWTCQTDSYLDRGKQDVVFLEGFSGCFSTKYLQSVQS